MALSAHPVGQPAVEPNVPGTDPSRAVKRGRVGLPVADPAAGSTRARKTTYLTAPDAVTPVVVAPRGTKYGQVGYGVASPEAGAVYPQVVIPDAVFGVAEESTSRWPVGVFKVDWSDQDYTGVAADLSRVVSKVSVERAITGELPDSTGYIDGFSTGTGKVELQGTRPGAALTLAAELSPFRPDSPLYGKTLVTPQALLDLGLLTDDGGKLYRQLTGPVRTVAIDEDGEQVEMLVVDPNERLRELVTLPTYGEFASHAKRRRWAITVNTQWLVDFVLRCNGIFASPPPHPRAIISATGHGGMVAERGFNGAPISINASAPPQGGLWTDDQHPWRMLGTPEGAGGATVAYQEFYGITNGIDPPMRFESGWGCTVSGWWHLGSYMNLGSSFENRLWQVRPTTRDEPRLFGSGYGNGEFYVGIVMPNGQVIGTPRIPVGSSRWRHIGVHYQFVSNTLLRCRVRVDGQVRQYDLTIPAVTLSTSAFYEGYKQVLQLRGQCFRAWSNLQLWTGYTPPTAQEWQDRENHVGQADIGRGINELLYLPDIAAVDSWDLLKAVVGAEFGVHGFSEVGRYFFRPRSDVRSPKVDKVIDVETNLSSVSYSISSDSVRNVIGYAATPKYHATDGKGPNGTTAVVKAEDVLQFTVPAGRRYTYEVDWPFGAAGWQGGILPYHYQKDAETAARDAATFAMWGSEVQHGWTYSTRGASGNWTILDNVQSVVVWYTQTSARRALIVVDNPGGKDIRLATAAPADASSEGEPALRIGGWPLQAQAAHVASYRNEPSIAKYRSARALDLPTSDWRQTPGVLDPVARQLLLAMAEALPILEDLPVRGDPRVQVGQVAALQFRGNAVPILGTIVKTVRELGAAGLNDKLSVRPLPEQTLAPAGWSFFLDSSHYQFEGGNSLDLRRARELGYAGLIAKIGQGAGHTTTTATSSTYGQTLDAFWSSTRDLARTLWRNTFAGYWYVGNDETPESQASRCAAAIGDKAIPVMLDWEDAGGDFTNLLNVLAAFRAAGLKVTMLYAGQGYVASAAGGGNPSNIDSATGLQVVRARYWTNEQDHPRVLFDDITDPRAFGLAAFNGATPDAFQFTQYGVIYPGLSMDVDAFPGTEAQLSRMFHNL